VGLYAVVLAVGCDAQDRDASEPPSSVPPPYIVQYQFGPDSIDEAKLSAGLYSLAELSGGFITGEVFRTVSDSSRAYVVGFVSTLPEHEDEIGITVLGDDGAHVAVLWTGIRETADGAFQIQDVHRDGDTLRIDFCRWPERGAPEALAVSLTPSGWTEVVAATDRTCPQF